MKFAFFTNSISPHQLPLANQIQKFLGEGKYRYIYTDLPREERIKLREERIKLGWKFDIDTEWCYQGAEDDPALYDSDIVMTGVRSFPMIERRIAQGKMTIYVSERWFKPPIGILRLLSPAYFKMARRMVHCFRSPCFYYFPMGVHAARDMARLLGLFTGDLRCIFRAPRVAFESYPGGGMVPLEDIVHTGLLQKENIQDSKRHGFLKIPSASWGKVKPIGIWEHMKMWGYFVEAGKGLVHTMIGGRTIKVLWVGRLIRCKRVDTIVKAIQLCSSEGVPCELDIFGEGDEKVRLQRLSAGASNIHFHGFLPIDQVRAQMRAHDVYVLSSDGYEGWGAVISEALEEKMLVLGSVDSGASATILDSEYLFEKGDYRKLARLLQKSSEMECQGIGRWTASYASKWLLSQKVCSDAKCAKLLKITWISHLKSCLW